LYRVLRNRPAEFEDLTQTTYERVIRTIGERRFEGRVELTAWAGAIAARVALEWLGRLTRERRLLGAVDAYSIFPPTYHALPERQVEARSEVRRLLGVIGRMKSKPATVLVLHDLLGHTVPEAAQILGINVSAAQTRLRRARVDFVKRCATDGSTIARAMR
jgi:RNA polymerase sigma-70 factor (ECF subfamily)